MHAVIWPHGRGLWSCGVHPPMRFAPHVEVDSEWGSSFDSTRFTQARVKITKETALEFLRTQNIEFIEELPLSSPRIYGLHRLAVRTVKG